MVRPMSETQKTRDFGYEEVEADEHTRRVRGVFDSVAKRYDLMNDLMSAGIHRLWKAELIRMLRPRADQVLADVGGGTGDLAFRFLEAGGKKVTIIDINEQMIRVGRDRALDRGLLDPVWVTGSAEDLPLPDNSVDAYVTAFAMRNVTRQEKALDEARRVLRPGGRYLCLEFSRVVIEALRPFYDAYSFNILPRLGQMVAGDAESYRYLAESIRRFPPQEDFASMIEAAGLSQVTWRNLSGGIAAIHSARRI
jgi:demethylmenaquinone methyltransferase/2-methoxy-6-polyprenyl-1,4-benzoquinol methylase